MSTIDIQRPGPPVTRPLSGRLLGTGLGLATRLRRAGAFTVTSVLDDARRRTGLTDPGPEHLWRPGLEVLLRSLDTEADLTPVGRWFARGQLVDLMGNRLQLVDAWRERPEVLQAPIERPIVIVGLPRTGSTLLQHLLALDLANRSLRQWEAARPAPPPPADDDDPRVATAERGFRLLSLLEPEARELHPGSPTQPTECVTLMANAFASWELAAINHVPAYLDWCLAQDLRPVYADLRAQLQLLQVNTPGARWVLKCPGHLFALDALLDALPSAVLVQTHRDPDRVLPSYCHLVSTLQRIGARRVDEAAIAERWTAAWGEALDRSAAVRAKRADIEVVDIAYADLVVDPLRVVRRIYDHAGRTLSHDAEATMRAYLGDPSHDARPVPSRPLSRFGIDVSTQPAYERYRRAHREQLRAPGGER
jgi:hypothetical protein